MVIELPRLDFEGSKYIDIQSIVGYPVPWDWISTNVKRAQDYLLQNTTLGIPAIVQTEGEFYIHTRKFMTFSNDL